MTIQFRLIIIKSLQHHFRKSKKSHLYFSGALSLKKIREQLKNIQNSRFLKIFSFKCKSFSKSLIVFGKHFEKLNYKIKIVCIILTVLRTFSNFKIVKGLKDTNTNYKKLKYRTLFPKAKIEKNYCNS